jgi:hypothetical protein
MMINIVPALSHAIELSNEVIPAQSSEDWREYSPMLFNKLANMNEIAIFHELVAIAKPSNNIFGRWVTVDGFYDLANSEGSTSSHWHASDVSNAFRIASTT